MSCSYLGMACIYFGMGCLYFWMECTYLGMTCLSCSMSCFEFEPSMMSCYCFWWHASMSLMKQLACDGLPFVQWIENFWIFHDVALRAQWSYGNGMLYALLGMVCRRWPRIINEAWKKHVITYSNWRLNMWYFAMACLCNVVCDEWHAWLPMHYYHVFHGVLEFKKHKHTFKYCVAINFYL